MTTGFTAISRMSLSKPARADKGLICHCLSRRAGMDANIAWLAPLLAVPEGLRAPKHRGNRCYPGAVAIRGGKGGGPGAIKAGFVSASRVRKFYMITEGVGAEPDWPRMRKFA
jgi:hypothetical protein